MIFHWLRNRRRKRLRQRPFPDAWRRTLERNAWFYGELSEKDRTKLRADIQVFVAEKNWEGCGGLEINDEIRVTIAAQACLLVLGFDNEYFDQVLSILVYPDVYIAPDQMLTKGGLVIEGESIREGEAWSRGPVILSWADALADGRRQSEGDNLVIHEFAHQLDMQNGAETDGVPPMTDSELIERWLEVAGAEFKQLQRDCELGRYTLLDCYGSGEPSEFFAVAAECFFVQPRRMRARHGRLYQLFRDYFRQDPAEWNAANEQPATRS